MNFFLNLLSCGHSKHPNKPPLPLPKLCPFGNQKTLHCPDNPTTLTTLNLNKSQSSSSKPLTQIAVHSPLTLPQTNFLLAHLKPAQKIRDIDWGYLVGTLNANRSDLNQMRTMSYCIQIGQHEQINSFESLRPHSLDHLLVFWKEHNQFTLAQLLTSPQRLMIVLEEQSQLKPVLRLLQQELLQKMGELCLKQSQSRISLDVIPAENKIVLEFSDPLAFHHHLQIMLHNIGVQLDCKHFQLLLQKMTLRDYIDVKKEAHDAKFKINHYLREIQAELKIQQESPVPPVREVRFETQSSSSDRKYKRETIHKSSDDQIQIYNQSLNYKHQLKEEASARSSIDDHLMIFDFNRSNQNEQSEEEQIHKSSKKTEPIRKKRSKSTDAPFIVDQFLDDELFDKY